MILAMEEESGSILNASDFEEQQKKEAVVFGTNLCMVHEKFTKDNFFSTALGYTDLNGQMCSETIEAGEARLKCVYREGDYH